MPCDALLRLKIQGTGGMMVNLYGKWGTEVHVPLQFEDSDRQPLSEYRILKHKVAGGSSDEHCNF